MKDNIMINFRETVLENCRWIATNMEGPVEDFHISRVEYFNKIYYYYYYFCKHCVCFGLGN
jgi:hypothetical protein